MIFAYSDLHLLHKNIGRYCNRPNNFTELIIKRHNEVVRDGDIILNLGDVGFGSADILAGLVESMKGTHIAVKGNHDKSTKWLYDCGFETVLFKHGQKIHISDNEYNATIIAAVENSDPRGLVDEGIVVSHEPLPNIKWPYLYGHTHNNPVPWDYMDRPYPISVIRGRNISIELLNYMPVPLPFLINDETWIKQNYRYWYKRLFNYDGKRKRSNPRSG